MTGEVAVFKGWCYSSAGPSSHTGVGEGDQVGGPVALGWFAHRTAVLMLTPSRPAGTGAGRSAARAIRVALRRDASR